MGGKNMNARLTAHFKQELLNGNVARLRAAKLVVEVLRVNADPMSETGSVDLTVALIDKEGNRLVDVYEQRIVSKGTLTVVDLDRLFDITLAP